MSGIEACKVIKANEFVGDVPVIMVTVHDDGEHLSNPFNAGAMDYVTKPVNRVELVSGVRSALELKRERDVRKRTDIGLKETLSELQDPRERQNPEGAAPHMQLLQVDPRRWDLLEAFISDTHPVCPACIKELYLD